MTNRSGEVLYTWNDSPTQVWSQATTEKVNMLLKKTIQAGTAKKAYIPNHQGGKTGTTNDYQDYWFVGLNDKHTTGVWIGKDKPQNLQYIEAASPQLLIWKDIMSGK